ncbi:MgtC/SapB family protein [Corallococcus exiguus]|uniref:hypothetical protein n=1 Tax=Corallococcus exiguus TaxID=83462 RepID=UPI0036F2AE8E
MGAASVLKRGSAIFGITTAASIWIAAAVGCDAALGNLMRAACVAPSIALTSWLMGLLERRVFRRKRVMAAQEETGARRGPRGRAAAPRPWRTSAPAPTGAPPAAR